MNATERLRKQAADRRELPPPALRRAIRKAAGATLEQVADAISELTGEPITSTSVGHWERNFRNPSRRHLAAYLEVLRLLQGVTESETKA